MAQRNIDFGAFPDDPDADAIRSAFEKVQLNFTEVFAGLGDQAVVSVNKTAGPGVYLVNGSPVGNVVLGANIACVQFSSTTLSVGRSPGTGPGSATITDSTQTLYIDLPNTIANITDVVVSGNVQGNAVIGNLSGDFGYVLANTSSGNGNINANNITLTGALAASNVSGNGAGLSAIAGSNVTGQVANALVAGTVYTTAQPNITSTGTLTTLDVQSTVTASAFTANTGLFSGDGGGLSNIVGANVTGEVTNSATANAVAGANVSGQVAFAGTANIVAGANVTGSVANATYADTSGTVETAAQPNITSVGSLSSLSVTGNVAGGNISTTGVLEVTGNVSAGNVSGTGGVFTYVSGDGANLTNISVSTGSYIEAGTSEARLDTDGPFRVTVGGTANVLQVNNTGTEVAVTGSMSVSGGLDNNINFNSTSNLGPVGNVTITGGVSGAFLHTDGAGTLTWNTGTVQPTQGTDTQIIFNDGGTTYAGNTGLTFNKTSGNVAIPGNLAVTSAVSGATLAGSLVTNAQPNITSVGTLTSLILGGTLNTNSDVITNAGNIEISAGTGSFKGNGAGLTNITGANVSEVPLATLATTATTANAVAGANVSGEVPFAQVANSVAGANVSGEVDFAATANAVAGANVTGAVSTATVATTVSSAAQSNITSVGTLTSLSVTGNVSAGNVSGTGGVFTYVSGDGANLTAIDGQQVTGEVDFAQVANSVAGANVSGTVALATSATSATTSGTVTTSAQPNITSVGTMTVLGVNGIVTAQSFTANTGLFTGDGGGLSNVAAANISGVVANATYATSAGSAALALDITGATQPNITAVGTLTSLTVSGNITNQTHIIKDVTVATAAGTNQSGATALAGADIFTVTTNTNDNGVRLMAATPGLCIFIKNTSGSNTLKVYPASNDAIDGNGTNGAMSIGPLGQIQFVAHSSAQWYTVGATYA